MPQAKQCEPDDPAESDFDARRIPPPLNRPINPGMDVGLAQTTLPEGYTQPELDRDPGVRETFSEGTYGGERQYGEEPFSEEPYYTQGLYGRYRVANTDAFADFHMITKGVQILEDLELALHFGNAEAAVGRGDGYIGWNIAAALFSGEGRLRLPGDDECYVGAIVDVYGAGISSPFRYERNGNIHRIYASPPAYAEFGFCLYFEWKD